MSTQLGVEPADTLRMSKVPAPGCSSTCGGLPSPALVLLLRWIHGLQWCGTVKHCLLILAAVFAAACSTRPVPGVCCIGVDECGRLGLSEDRPCPAGQACVGFQCAVPLCSIQGCAAEAPVCDIATDTCSGCSDSSECSRFPDTGVCDPQTGSCVECIGGPDCPAPGKPICDGGSCRGCRLDDECPSGACGDDGACIAEADVVYVHPAGQDVAPCSRSAPCKDLQFGIRQTTMTRNHVVMAAGAYPSQEVGITATYTPALALFIHGHGAKISGSSEVLFSIIVPTTIRDLDIESSGLAILAAQAVLERIHIRAATGLQVDGPITARDLFIEATNSISNFGGVLTLDRGTLVGGALGIYGFGTIDVKNLLVYGTSDTALDLSNMRGSVSFTTVADSGSASSTAAGIRCPYNANTLVVRSSIFWTPGGRPAAAGECTFSSTIAGPLGAIGAMNSDPLFVDAANRNYRLSAGSPARDTVDAGPATDFEGDPRPRGPRFDIGADEAQ